MTVLVTKPAVNIREELADLKDQTTYDTVKSAGALMDAELANEAAVKGIDQALTTTSSVEFTQVTAALVGNASTATTLATARDIALSGDVTGSASFDGSGNIDITATVADDSHNHTIANVDGLQTALDAKQPLDADLTAIAALSSADGNIIVGSAAGWVAESGATARASLGLVIGEDVQAHSDDLGTYASNPLTTSELQQLQNIGTATVSETQWGYVGALNQGLATTNSPTFNTVTAALTGNAATATALEVPRTIGLTGDVTATGVSFDGSANISLTADIAANVVGATELNVTGNGTSGQVLASDGDGSFSWAGQGLSDTGTINTGITFADDAYLRVGTGTDLQIKSDGTDVEALLGSGSDLNIQASSTGFTYLSKSGSASGDTPVVGGAQNTYASAATTGGGVGFGLRSPNGNGVSLNATTLYGRYSDVTNGSEDTYLQIETYVAGTPTTVATFRGDQASTINSDLSVTGALKQNGSDVLTTASGVPSYSDTTANFTGTLQNGGNAVLTTATGATTGKAIAMAMIFG